MNLRQFLLALTAVAMLAATVASSASAAMEPAYQWYTGNPGVTLPLGSSAEVSCKVGFHEGSANLVLKVTVGSEFFTLQATGIDCKEAKIFNEKNAAGTAVIGKDSGRLLFTGVTVVEPTGCAVAGGQVTTEPLKSELYKEVGVAGKVFDKFEPATTGGNFATVEITGTCGVAGNRIVKGNVFGEATNTAGTTATSQALTFSSTIDTTTGSALKFAGNEAHLTGQVVNSLVSGAEFEAK